MPAEQPDEHAPATLRAASELIRARRTWKPENMDPHRAIPTRLLEELLENANWAPTHGLTEPWRFVIFRDRARARFAAQLQQLYADHTPEGEFRPDKHAKLGRTPTLADTVIAICMTRQPHGQIPEIEEVEAVACAVQNLHLSAAAAGLAAKWSSPPICYHPAMNELLGLTPADKCLGLFYLGWPHPDAKPPASARKDVADKVRWVDN